MDKINIMLVDDHPLVLEGLRLILSSDPDVVVTGAFSDAEELFAALPHSLPDVLLLDISLPGLSGIEITRKVLQEFPAVRILILTALSDEQTVSAALAAGAAGYLPKDSRNAELLKAIHQVYEGHEYLGERIAEKVIGSYIRKARSGEGPQTPGTSVLSERESEILQLIARGLTHKEIGVKLFISPRTVEAHKNNLCRKLGVNTLADLIAYAIRNTPPLE